MPFATVNPTTGAVEATYAEHDAGEVDAILDKAAAGYRALGAASFTDRSRLMVTAAELLEGELPDVAHMVTTEMGKPFAQAKGEVAKCALALRWFAEHAEALLADDVIEEPPRTRRVRYEPIGPVLAIMPWNFPLWQVVRFAAPALMLGNVGICKHAPNVPQTAEFLEGLFRRSGYPDGAFTNLRVDTDRVAGVIADDRVAGVTLTGSERAGRAVGRAAGEVL